jgi:alkanesulfonate monooxygenase SsuD/methylene tetrahydromethanopterin reductase-like flavin-dependent oxidoreductase (luciferase family)
MVHTFLGDNIAKVKDDVVGPFSAYLKTHYHLLEGLARGMGLKMKLEDFSEDDLNSLLQFGVEGFMNGRSLIGTPESCRPLVKSLAEAGVNEIACLIDFVQDYDLVMTGLPHIAALAREHAAVAEAALV